MNNIISKLLQSESKEDNFLGRYWIAREEYDIIHKITTEYFVGKENTEYDDKDIDLMFRMEVNLTMLIQHMEIFAEKHNIDISILKE